MATISQVKALLRAHFDNDLEKFKVIALQLAAHEAKLGHAKSAREIKDLVLHSPAMKSNIIKLNQKSEILELSYPSDSLYDLILSEELMNRINRVLEEYQKRDLLLKNGLKNRSKLLLEGDPGTGKTMTASVIANELAMPLYFIKLDQLISKYMGETSVKLKKVFEQIRGVRGVYLFDEFDAIGADRSYDNDVGEMRRILNSFLQYIEQDDSASIIIAATNNPNMLDRALFRRFDDVLEYRLPDNEQIKKLIERNLEGIATINVISEDITKKSLGLNHADVVNACREAAKYTILNNSPVNEEILLMFIQDRKKLRKYQGVK